MENKTVCLNVDTALEMLAVTWFVPFTSTVEVSALMEDFLGISGRAMDWVWLYVPAPTPVAQYPFTEMVFFPSVPCDVLPEN